MDSFFENDVEDMCLVSCSARRLVVNNEKESLDGGPLQARRRRRGREVQHYIERSKNKIIPGQLSLSSDKMKISDIRYRYDINTSSIHIKMTTIYGD
jgi:hypothetical protein